MRRELHYYRGADNINKEQHKTLLLRRIQEMMEIISQGKSLSLSYEDCYRTIFTYYTWFCENAAINYSGATHDNIREICNMLDKLTFTSTKDVQAVKDICIYLWNAENRYNYATYGAVRKSRHFSEKIEHLFEKAEVHENRTKLFDIIRQARNPKLPKELWDLVVNKVSDKTMLRMF